MKKFIDQQVDNFKRNLLRSYIEKLTDKQQEFFKVVYPGDIMDEQLDNAIGLVRRTLKRTRRKTGMPTTSRETIGENVRAITEALGKKHFDLFMPCGLTDIVYQCRYCIGTSKEGLHYNSRCLVPTVIQLREQLEKMREAGNGMVDSIKTGLVGKMYEAKSAWEALEIGKGGGG